MHIESQYNSKKTDLSDEGGLSTHVRTCYDLKPALPSHLTLQQSRLLLLREFIQMNYLSTHNNNVYT